MYIKFSEIRDGVAVSWCELLDSAFHKLVDENPDKLFATIDTNLDLSTFSEQFYFNNDKWSYRGTRPSIYHQWDVEERKWFPDLSKARAAKQIEIDERLYSLIYLPCNGFDADKVSRERISGMIARLQRGDGLPAGWVGWRDAENNMHWVTDDAATVLANLTALSRAIEDREQALLIAGWQHKANIAALIDIDAILGYDVTANWPT